MRCILPFIPYSVQNLVLSGHGELTEQRPLQPSGSGDIGQGPKLAVSFRVIVSF
jgi:hypothetical protein